MGVQCDIALESTIQNSQSKDKREISTAHFFCGNKNGLMKSGASFTGVGVHGNQCEWLSPKAAPMRGS